MKIILLHYLTTLSFLYDCLSFYLNNISIFSFLYFRDTWISEDETVNIREGSIVRLRIIGLVIDAGVIVSYINYSYLFISSISSFLLFCEVLHFVMT